MWIKRDVVMLPTNEKAGLGSIYKRIKDDEIGNIDEFDTIGKLFINKNPNVQKSNSNFEAQHLYTLSDEEIKEGDWVCNGTEIWQVKSDYGFQPLTKKIITTTDTNLKIEVGDEGWKSAEQEGWNEYKPIYKALPQPSQQFIEKYIEEYNKGNIITQVMVEYEKKIEVFGGLFATGKERVELKINPKDNTITIRKVKDSWNKEEVETIYRQGRNDAYQETKSGFDLIDIVNASDKWIKENL